MRSTLPIPGMRKLILGLIMGLSALITAHIVNAFVGHALFVPEMLPPPSPSQDNAIQHSVSPQKLAQDLMTRGLFALPQESSQTAGSSKSAAMGPPLEAAKKLLLQGTALGNGNEPMAIIQDRTNQQQKLLHLHDHVPNVGELVSIEQTRVLFKEGGQEEWLELAMLTDLEQARRVPPLPESLQGRLPALSQPARLASPAYRAGLTRVVSSVAAVPSTAGSRPIQIFDRRELSKTLSDIPHLLLQAQPVVSMIDGRFNGILLEAVRFDGWYSKMGLQSGDVLKRINGVELRDPSMLIAGLQQMKDEHRVKLDLVRNEAPRTLTYEIQ
jgi:general secretion pathway protein C